MMHALSTVKLNFALHVVKTHRKSFVDNLTLSLYFTAWFGVIVPGNAFIHNSNETLLR